MSGPKCSDYTVNEEIRRMLELQRAEELRIIAEQKRQEELRRLAEKKRKEEELRKIAEQKRQEELRRLAEEKRKEEELRKIAEQKRQEELRRLAEEKRKEELRRKKELIMSISSTKENIKNQVKVINNSINVEEIKFNGDDCGLKASVDLLKEIEIKVNKLVLKADINSSISELDQLKKEIEYNEYKLKEEAKRIGQINQKIEEKYNVQISNDIKLAFSNMIEEKDDDLDLNTQEDKINDLIVNVKEELCELNELDLSVELKEKIKKTLDNLEKIDKRILKNFIAIDVIPLIKDCQLFKKEQEECEKQYDELIIEYEAYCEKYAIEKQNFTKTKIGTAYLKDSIEDIKKKAQKEDEDAYIAKSIDEAMIEMGYDVLGYQEVTKSSGKRIRKDLYKFKDGTAVNVSRTSDGQITMELGAIDSVDREPTKDEKQYLCDDMKAFCKDFENIEKILEKKGVILKNRISHLQPSAEYAQIINTSDYTITTRTNKAHNEKEMRIDNEKV